ncbi:hypothetical protein LCGC14_2173950 [marine sediment metagenome]|uniref:Cysteine-rich small domain-containing protein n=1 Tax=marine sediment metagenome TaxID=412755 RepID=A0A0F9GK18_9ZZZZ
MLNGGCKFLPCHKGLEDCTFCFCPIYPCNNLKYGKWAIRKPSTYASKKIWDCSKCTFFHKTDNVEKIKELIRDMINEEN